MNKFSKLMLLGATTMCIATLSSCRKNADNTIQQEGRFSIVYYPGGYGDEYLKEFCRNFLAEKKGKNPSDIVEGTDYLLVPDVDITYGAEYYLESEARCPDLIVSNVLLANAVTKGLVANLDDVFSSKVSTSKGERTIRQFASDAGMEAAIEQYSYQLRLGQTATHAYAMPWTSIPISVAYNNTLLHKIPHVSSIPVGEDAIVDGKWNRAPETVTELKACFEDAQAYDSRLTKFGWAANDGTNWFESLITTWWAQKQGVESEYSYAGQGSYYDFWAYESEEIFKQTGIQDALQTIKDLLISGGEYVNSFPTVGSMSIKEAQQEFAEGKALFCLTGDFFENEYSSFIAKSGQEFKLMRVPAIEGALTNSNGTVKKLAYLNISSCAYVPAKAANKDLAKEFLVYTSKEDNCIKMSTMTGAIRPFDYDVRTSEAAANLSSFKKSVFDLFYESDDYLIKYPRKLNAEEISPIYLYERVSESIFCGSDYPTVISQLKSSTPAQIMVSGDGEFKSIYERAKKAFSEWSRLYNL